MRVVNGYDDLKDERETNEIRRVILGIGAIDDLDNLFRAPLSVPVGRATLGLIFNVLGEPVDNLGPVDSRTTTPIHRSAPALIQLDTKLSTFETGIKVVDLLAPYRRGGKIGLFRGAGVALASWLYQPFRPMPIHDELLEKVIAQLAKLDLQIHDKNDKAPVIANLDKLSESSVLFLPSLSVSSPFDSNCLPANNFEDGYYDVFAGVLIDWLDLRGKLIEVLKDVVALTWMPAWIYVKAAGRTHVDLDNECSGCFRVTDDKKVKFLSLLTFSPSWVNIILLYPSIDLHINLGTELEPWHPPNAPFGTSQCSGDVLSYGRNSPRKSNSPKFQRLPLGQHEMTTLLVRPSTTIF
ncbi:hypothetical protein Syun_020977 [Stephania yunnanensis]|uniref:H(+)-transporting two-sector ATPase n=1 Tax=Stephania yunnanensis TaxID=152371 RepID=A0AAP0IFH0_9MAGN